jgi:molybdopterin-guanine dinucleotide biosynthesis protein A
MRSFWHVVQSAQCGAVVPLQPAGRLRVATLAEQPVPDPRTAIVIAAGGDGSRIGGAKAAQLLAGRRLIDHARDWALTHADAVALAVRSDAMDWGTGLPLLVDRHPGLGPISALASAFRFAQAMQRQAVLMIGCDTPFLPADLLPRLWAARQSHGAVLPSSGDRRHPMAALWRPDGAAIDAYIVGGGRSLWGFAEQCGAAEVDWPETPDPFFNINRSADLVVAEARFGTAQS